MHTHRLRSFLLHILLPGLIPPVAAQTAGDASDTAEAQSGLREEWAYLKHYRATLQQRVGDTLFLSPYSPELNPPEGHLGQVYRSVGRDWDNPEELVWMDIAKGRILQVDSTQWAFLIMEEQEPVEINGQPMNYFREGSPLRLTIGKRRE